jgi:signal transduction histidine kinase
MPLSSVALCKKAEGKVLDQMRRQSLTRSGLLLVVILSVLTALGRTAALQSSIVTTTQTTTGNTITIKARVVSAGQSNSLSVRRVQFTANNQTFAVDRHPDAAGLYDATLPPNETYPIYVTLAAYDVSQHEVAQHSLTIYRESTALKGFAGFIAKTPLPVAKGFPYVLFVCLAVLAVWLLRQAAREVKHSERLRAIIESHRLVAEGKDNFLSLSVHYLNTPLTLMNSGLELLVGVKQISVEQAEIIKAPLIQLATQVKQLVHDTENNTALAAITKPSYVPSKAIAYASPQFIWPLVVVAVLIISADYLFGIIGQLALGTLNILTQVIVFLLLGFMLYSAIRTRLQRRDQYRRIVTLLEHEVVLDAARNDFIEQSHAVLEQYLQAIKLAAVSMGQAGQAKHFWEGYNRFAEILGRYELLASLESKEPATDSIDLTPLLQQAWQTQIASVQSKSLQQSTSLPPVSIKQNSRLITFVVHSIVDNAVKFSPEHGTVTLELTVDNHAAHIQVSNGGAGIPEDHLARLIQPFSRAESAETFNYEGIGLSLYLDKLILDYLGGKIAITSKPQKTTVSVLIPLGV